MEEIDVWRSAQQLIQTFGDEAALHAALRANQLLDEGDVEGCRVMQRVVAAIETLQSRERRPGETMN